MFDMVLFIIFSFSACFVVIEAKDGTISVASAFSGHQEGNLSNIAYLKLFLWSCLFK